MNGLSLKAYAKINIGLDITGRRKDGYHLLKTCMQTISLYDEITVIKNPGNQEEEIKIAADKSYVPKDETNICAKAASLIKKEYRIKDKFLIYIKKNIPVGGGLAGGSTDGGAVIKALNYICGLDLSDKELDGIAVRLGADVPFCLRRGLWLCEGIGEILTPLPSLGSFFAVIIKPDFEVSTPWSYKTFDSLENVIHPDMDGAVDAVRNGDIKALCEKTGNVLELATGLIHPEIEEIKDQMRKRGAILALMSGSGSTTFGLFDDKDKALEALEYFKICSYVEEGFLTELVY